MPLRPPCRVSRLQIRDIPTSSPRIHACQQRGQRDGRESARPLPWSLASRQTGWLPSAGLRRVLAFFITPSACAHSVFLVRCRPASIVGISAAASNFRSNANGPKNVCVKTFPSSIRSVSANPSSRWRSVALIGSLEHVRTAFTRSSHVLQVNPGGRRSRRSACVAAARPSSSARWAAKVAHQSSQPPSSGSVPQSHQSMR